MNKIINLLVIIIVTVTATSCNLGNRYKTTDSEYDNQKAEVKEVIQTSNYTYLRVEKKDLEQWIAIGKMEVKAGEVIYFENGLEMTNFESPELGRTFESVLFVQEISNEPIKRDGMPGGMPGGMGGGKGKEIQGDKPEKPVLSKLDIKVEQPEGGTTISNLYAKRADYVGKLVTVRGQVTKVNVGIMNRNWVHLQDGTSDGENFDLTITTDDEPAMGTVVTYSGTFSVKKDFGYGYYYEIILEDAEPVKAM